MALVPPPNLSGVPLPQNPQNPVIYDDIAQARDYLEGLTYTRIGNTHPNPATDHEVGLAEAYKTALVFACAPGPAAPPWLANLQVQVNQIAADVAAIRNDIAQSRREQPILLANSQAGTRGRLYDPTANGWVLLVAPNPATRDELMKFTQAQCIASAIMLGLPPFPANPPVLERRRQIAARIGVTI